MRTAIDSAGRLVIPKPIRDAAGLKAGVEVEVEYRDGKVEIEGVEVEVEYRDGKVEIEPSRSQINLVRKGSLLVASTSGKGKLTQKQVSGIVREVRERRA
jgi:AbrB family looped-hinge helix DNA binding protein